MTGLRTAEIYAWNHEENKRSGSWIMQWMEKLQRNKRNDGFRQSLSSRDFIIGPYQVGELTIVADRICCSMTASSSHKRKG